MINGLAARKHSALVGFVLFAAAVAVSAQNKEVQSPQPNEILQQQYWLTAADNITTDLKEDAIELSNWQRVVLLMRLSEIWRQYNQESADRWFREALEALSRNIDMEDSVSFRSRMITARKLLNICSQISKSCTEQITTALLELVSRSSARDKENTLDGKFLIQAATGLLHVDVESAIQLARVGMHDKQNSYLIAGFLFDLNKQDSQLAIALFEDALISAQHSNDYNLLYGLAEYAFPRDDVHPGSKSPVSDSLRQGLLNVIAVEITIPGAITVNRQHICNLAPTAARLFSRLPAEKRGMVYTIITDCQQVASDGLRSQINEALPWEENLNTIDGLLERARAFKEPERRAPYLLRASYTAETKGDLERAIAILDQMNPRDQEQVAAVWDSKRWSLAEKLIVSHLNKDDWGTIYRIIDNTPVRLRPLLEIRLAERIRQTHRQLCLDLCNSARTGLQRIDADDKAYWLFALASVYAEVDRFQALGVFREGINALNRETEIPNQQTSHNIEVEIDNIRPASFTKSLIQADLDGLTQACASINAPISRTAVRLGLLKTLLEQTKK